MKQNFANLGTRTRESGQIFAAPTEWARKLLLILLGDTDLPANRHFKSKSSLSPDHFSRPDQFGGTVLHPGGQIWGGVALGRSFRAGDSCDHRGLNPGWCSIEDIATATGLGCC